MSERRRLTLVAVPLVVLSAAGIAAAAFTPLLLRDAPLLLLALESRNRYLLLVAARVDVVPFVAVGVLRRLASDPFYYLLGRWYGDRAVRWVERRAGEGRTVRAAEALFRRVRDVAVLLFPGALICVLAGSTAMRPRRFLVLNVLGSLGIVIVLRLVAAVAAGPLRTIVAFSDDNAGWLTAVFVGLTGLWLLVEHRRVRGQGVRDLGEPEAPMPPR